MSSTADRPTAIGAPLLFLITCLVALIGIPMSVFLGYVASTIWLALSTLVVGCWVFLFHGAGRATVLGLFNLATGLFVGLGAVMALADGFMRVPDKYLAIATGGSLVSLSLVNVLSWQPSDGRYRESKEPVLTRPTSSTLLVCGLAIYLSATIVQVLRLVGPISYVAEGFAYVGIVAFAIGVLFRPDSRLVCGSTVALAALVLLYATVNHSGTGRLRIVALACSVSILVVYRFPRARLKGLIVAGLPISLWLLALVRLNYQESLSTGASEGRSGLESMISPIVTLSEVLYAQTLGWPIREGRTLFSVFFIGTPPEAEPSWAPEALGYDLLRLTDPSRVGSGASHAVTVFGEGVWNFGLVGFLFIVPVIVIVVRFLEWSFISSLHLLSTERVTAVVLLVLVVAAVGSIGDFSWNGLHTFMSRVLTRVPGVVLLSFMLLIVAAGSRSRAQVVAIPGYDHNHRLSGSKSDRRVES